MPQKKLTDNEVLQRVKKLAKDGRLGWTNHSEDQMAMRGYDKDQVKSCLQSGWFKEMPHDPNRPGSIEYKFTMSATLEGRGIEVVASLNPDTKVTVITVIDPDAQ